ncbi:MAG: histidine triad nucleotide-binding protein [Candidatus Methanoperedens sp.]|nr:histidine triad nucleotide-binding protein [Candidatus Methanoperedens sp.]MCZ7394862.1 histidine triad nucleotide-binding protein [Candidatus Methanoperedens sp.]
MTSDCIFCKIIKGEAPANFIYRDENMVVFHDTRPKAPVHVLILPVEHIESVNSLDERHSAIISRMILKAKEIARILGIDESGYKVIINVGRGGGQIIFHLHIHLIGGWARSEI